MGRPRRTAHARGVLRGLVAVTGADRDFVAALGAATAENSSARLGLHAAEEAVGLRAATAVRLKSTLRHGTELLKAGDTPAGTFWLLQQFLIVPDRRRFSQGLVIKFAVLIRGSCACCVVGNTGCSALWFQATVLRSIAKEANCACSGLSICTHREDDSEVVCTSNGEEVALILFCGRERAAR